MPRRNNTALSGYGYAHKRVGSSGGSLHCVLDWFDVRIICMRACLCVCVFCSCENVHLFSASASKCEFAGMVLSHCVGVNGEGFEISWIKLDSHTEFVGTVFAVGNWWWRMVLTMGV